MTGLYPWQSVFLCDRIGIINKGKLIAMGTMEELRHGDQADSLENIFLELTER